MGLGGAISSSTGHQQSPRGTARLSSASAAQRPAGSCGLLRLSLLAVPPQGAAGGTGPQARGAVHWQGRVCGQSSAHGCRPENGRASRRVCLEPTCIFEEAQPCEQPDAFACSAKRGLVAPYSRDVLQRPAAAAAGRPVPGPCVLPAVLRAALLSVVPVWQGAAASVSTLGAMFKCSIQRGAHPWLRPANPLR